MDITRQEPEQVKVVLSLSSRELQDLDVEIKQNKKYRNMPILQDIVSGIFGMKKCAANGNGSGLMDGKHHRRITKDHVTVAEAYLKKHKKVSGWDLQRDRIMGWNYAIRSLDKLVRDGKAQCHQKGRRKYYMDTSRIAAAKEQPPVEYHEHGRKASYLEILKERVAKSVENNGLMYMRDIANSIRMTAEDRKDLRGILEQLVTEGRIRNIHAKHGGHPRYAPMNMRIPEQV